MKAEFCVYGRDAASQEADFQDAGGLVRDERLFVSLSRKEKLAARVLVVEQDQESREQIVAYLRRSGFGRVSETSTHAAAFYKFEDRRFTHMLFSAKQEAVPVREWLAEIFEMNPGIIAIAVTTDPSLDDIFSLLIEGSRGFLVKPFTDESLEYVIATATTRDLLRDKVRKAGEPITAILAMVMTALDTLAIVRRQSKKYETARRELVQAEESMRRTADLFKLLTKAKQEELFAALQRFFIGKSSGPASPLGRLRKRLSEGRGSGQSQHVEAATSDNQRS